MNILIANDDGIEARGLRELVKALKQNPEIKIYVCAPDGQRSASGHGITMKPPIVLREATVEGAELAYACSGLPADCVKLGIRAFRWKGVEIDMVFSGINHGSNLGTDTLYSGTVAAAIEGAICGKPAVAVSLCGSNPTHFESCYEIAVKMVDVADKLLKGHSGVINVNVPDLPAQEIQGVVAAELGSREYVEHFYPVNKEAGIMECGYSGEAVYYEGLDKTIDVGGYQQNYITVSPLQYNLTDYHKLSQLSQLVKETC